MRDLATGTHWALAGARGEYAAGNGAAMRVAPLAFLLDPADSHDRTSIRDVCRITHHNDEAYVGALAVVLAIRSVLSGNWLQQRSFLTAAVDDLPDSAVRDRVKELLPLQLTGSEVARRFGAPGNVVDTVPLALYCAQFIASEPLTSVLAQTVCAGGDTDTIASIAGQLAGVVWERPGCLTISWLMSTEVMRSSWSPISLLSSLAITLSIPLMGVAASNVSLIRYHNPYGGRGPLIHEMIEIRSCLREDHRL